MAKLALGHGKAGHLWQDRFKSALIEKDNYLLECGRYIERNPLGANLVKDPEEYLWSSYTVYPYLPPNLPALNHAGTGQAQRGSSTFFGTFPPTFVFQQD